MSDENNNEPLSGGDDFKTLERHAEEHRSKDQRSEVIEAVPSIYMRGTIYLFVGVIILSLLLTYFAKVYVIVPTKGSILPAGHNVVVESESAGVITDVKVSLGEKVSAGGVLMELRQDAAGVGLLTLRDQLKIHQGNYEKAEKAIKTVKSILSEPKAVIEAPLDNFNNAGPAMVFVANLRGAIQGVERLQESLKTDLVQQRNLMDSQIALQKTTIASLKLSQASSLETIETLEQSWSRKKENLEKTIELAEKRVVTQTQVNQARDQVLSTKNALTQQRQQLSQHQLSVTQAEVEIGNQRTQFEKLKRELKNDLNSAKLAYDKALSDLSSSLSTLSQALETSSATISELQGKMRMHENTIDKLTIKSPVAGEITALNYNTQGQSVGAGSRVAVIVPSDVHPIIMVVVPNKDIAGVVEGISARVKVNAYPFRQFGTVKAEVVRVFPLVDKPEFGVRLRLEQNFIQVNDKPVLLEPGLEVEVDLLTKRKRILELIFKQMS